MLGFITQAEITHRSLSHYTVDLNTVICPLMHCLNASKLPCYSCSGQSLSQKSVNLPTASTEMQQQIQVSAEYEQVTISNAWTIVTRLDPAIYIFLSFFFPLDCKNYTRIKNLVYSCHWIIGLLQRQAYRGFLGYTCGQCLQPKDQMCS